MKRTTTIEATFCDACNQMVNYADKCLVCGKDYCFECAKHAIIAYPAGVHFTGGKDGHYCTSCERKVLGENDHLIRAYLWIRDLRAEEKRWYADFKMRVDAAEAEVVQIWEARGL